MLYLGAHTVDNGGIDMAARRAGSAGMKALQIFTAIPKYYGDKVSIRPERVERFRAALAGTSIEPRHVVAHAAYVLNTATPESDKWTRARDGLTKELERSTKLGIGVVCFHPGAATDGDTTAAAERVASAIVRALEHVPGDTRVLVENTAGAGKTFARTAAEVGAILNHIPKGLRPRTGYGLDTCHLWSSGYDIRASRDALTRVLDEFETAAARTARLLSLERQRRRVRLQPRSTRADRRGYDRRRPLQVAARGPAREEHSAHPRNTTAEYGDCG